jgi:hypothetical protein
MSSNATVLDRKKDHGADESTAWRAPTRTRVFASIDESGVTSLPQVRRGRAEHGKCGCPPTADSFVTWVWGDVIILCLRSAGHLLGLVGE